MGGLRRLYVYTFGADTRGDCYFARMQGSSGAG